MANENDWQDVEHSPVASSEFTGFANSPVDEDGKVLDAREVPSYDDITEDGGERKRIQTTESSVVAHRTSGTSTNGYPAAQVPAPAEPVQEEGASDEREESEESEESEDSDQPDSEAEGQGANGSA